MAAVQRLCSRAFVIDYGRLIFEGKTAAAVSAYLDRAGPDELPGVAVIRDRTERFEGSRAARLRKVTMTDVQGQPTSSVRLGERFRVTLTFEVFEAINEAVVELGICTPDGQRFATMQSSDRAGPPLRLMPAMFEVAADVGITLLPGEYVLEVALHNADGATADFVYRAMRFTALNVPTGEEESYPWPVVRGFVRPEASWTDAHEASSETVSSGAWPTS